MIVYQSTYGEIVDVEEVVSLVYANADILLSAILLNLVDLTFLCFDTCAFVGFSPGKSKTVQKKKQNKNRNSERLSKNYFYACDCLFNTYLDQTGNRMTILSLKESGPVLTQLLSQLSAGIVGTGLAVLISVACKAMNGNIAPLTSAKLLNVTFGFGLFWLSSAVNSLRDTIYRFSKRSARAKRPNEEAAAAVENVRRSMNEILFRFVALMVVGVISF